MAKRINIVHYCPGSASGSPASMPLEQAHRQLEQDMKYIEVMTRVGAIVGRSWPHIGGTCAHCQRRRENYGLT